MELAEAPKARLPSLLSRVFSRPPREGVDMSFSPVTGWTTSKSCYQGMYAVMSVLLSLLTRCGPFLAPNVLDCTLQPPASVYSGSQVHLPPLPAEHGKGCLPGFLSSPFRFFPLSNTPKAVSPNATSSKTRFATPKRVMPRLRAPLSPLSRKPGSSSSSFCISSPICTTPTKDHDFQLVHVRSPGTKQLPRLPSRFSEYTFLSEAGIRAAQVEPSNASSELLNVSSECLVAEANRLLPDFTKEPTLDVPSRRRRRKVPPAVSVDDWEIVDRSRDCSQTNESGDVLPRSADGEDKTSAIAEDVLSKGEEVNLEGTVIAMTQSPKVLAFGTNAALPDEIVQAFLRTQVFRRRPVRARPRKASNAQCFEGLATMYDTIRNAANEDEQAFDAQTATSDNPSPLPTSGGSGYRSEDTPTSATTPALSSADTASLYSCSSAACSTADDVTVAVSSPNESDLDGKCFEAIMNGVKEQMAAIAVAPSPRQLVARSFPSGLSISIPLKVPPIHSAIAGKDNRVGCPVSPIVVTDADKTSPSSPHPLAPVKDHGVDCFATPSREDLSVPSIEMVSKERRSRRQGTLYGKHEPTIPFPTRSDSSSPCRLGPKPELSAPSVADDETGRLHLSLSYRSERKPGLRPLLLPQLLPQYNDQRSPRSPSTPGSPPPLTPREDQLLRSPSPCSEQTPTNKVLGDLDIEWSPVTPSLLNDRGNDGFQVLRPEHIKLRRSKSSARLLLAPGPAF